MLADKYDEVAQGLMDLAREIEVSKRPGYTIGSPDVLANFKAVAARTGLTVGQVWAVYFLKHVDAMVSIMTRPDLPVSEAPPGRFADSINYTRLGFAILEERRQSLAEDSSSSPSSPGTSGTSRPERTVRPS